MNTARRKPQLDARPRQLRPPPQPGPEQRLQNANRPPTPGRFPWGGWAGGCGHGAPAGRPPQQPNPTPRARGQEEAPGTTAVQPEARRAGWVASPQKCRAAAKAPTAPPGPSSCPRLPAQAGMPQLFPGPRPQTSLPWGRPRLQGGFMVRGSSPHRARAARARPTQQPRCLLAKQPGRSQKCWHQPGCSRRHPQDGQASP